MQRLTREIVETFGVQSKEELMIKVVINVEKTEVILVPSNDHHLYYILKILKLNRNEIEKNPGILHRYIGGDIFIKEGEIVGVLTGYSGIESGTNVKHNPDDVQIAHGIIWQFINEGEMPVAKKLEVNKVIFK